ncbi:MAG: cell division topological specificity factor MinE [Helicobacteraceae bacterium]|jgi:cell division topological specificity factor MinE|nr:cell division topological specificity factor MinE [Helicobacteraceae bacterium]
MSFFGSLFGSKKSANIAKERLTITLARERASASFGFIDQMRDEILSVIKRYASVNDIRIFTNKNQKIDRLEIEVDIENGK